MDSTLTPNLDALMEQATPGPWRVSGCQSGENFLIEHGGPEEHSPFIGSVYTDGGNLPQDANAILITLFGTHAPALVAALTACVRPGHHIDCGMADPDNPICDCGNEEARAVLLKLDQEAKG